MNTKEIENLYKAAITKTMYDFNNIDDYTEKQQKVLEDLKNKIKDIEDHDKAEELISDVARRFAEDVSNIIDLDENTEFAVDYGDGRFELESDDTEYWAVVIPSYEAPDLYICVGYTETRRHEMWNRLV